MRIALVAPLVTRIGGAEAGGSQALVGDLARGLSRRGHELTLYAAEGSRVPGVELASLGIDAAGFTTLRARPGRPLQDAASLHQAYRAVYADVQRRGFEVVHSHGFDIAAVEEAARAGIAALHTLHLPPDPRLAQAIAAVRATAVPCWCACVSSAHAAAWAAHVRVDSVLRNGVPVDEIAYRARPGVPADAVVVARFSPEKGVVESVAAARAAGLPVRVIGTAYDGEYEAAVRARFASDAAVRFVSALPRTQVWRALGNAQVAVCLSLWGEPFGMVAAEAEAAGTPVAASDRGGLGEVVCHGKTGVLADASDGAAAAAAVRRALSLDRASCRRHAERHLSLAASLDAHEALYARLRRAVSAPPARGPAASAQQR